MKNLTSTHTQPVVLSRRGLLQLGASGLALAVGGTGQVWAQAPAQPVKYGGDNMPGGTVDNPLVFVSVATDGTVSVVCHRSEMGQGIRTSVPMIVADELEADFKRVRVVQAPGNEAIYGNQNTDGSRSIRHSFDPLRRVGAAARAMLEAAAAAKWGVPVSEVQARNHEIIHWPTGRTVGFGEVAQAAAALPVPARETLKLKTLDQFRYIGRNDMGSLDGADIVQGKAIYGTDVRLEGMMYAVIARPQVMGGKVKKYDASKTLAVPGVIKVVEIAATPLPAGHHPMGGIAVIAKNTWAAIKGREALSIEWDDGAHAVYDSKRYKSQLQANVRQPGKMIRNDGDADKILAESQRKVTAEYYAPHIAHATMEPPVATARIVDGKVEIWAPSQVPAGARAFVAQKLGLTPDKVTVNVTLLGGGFGRKSKFDFVCEAALLSKAMDGKPVKVQWTREDDLHNCYYHAAAYQRLEAALDGNGKPTAWLHRTASPSILSLFMPNATMLPPNFAAHTALNVPFVIPNLRIETPEAPAHTRIGWFRAVYNLPHAFAVQSFVAEMAAAAGRDPKDYLLELIGPARRIDPRKLSDNANYGESPERYPIDTGRMARVVEMAAKGAGWGKKLPKGHGLGVAVAYSFMSYAACAIEVKVGPKGQVQVISADLAIDCGPQVNPERIRSQLEGAAIQGIGLALTGEISFAGGKVVQGNFHDASIPRYADMPLVTRTHLAPADYSVAPGGVGEPGLPPVAPALCNAIFAATGKRIRDLPVRDQLKA
jgi:isoquinoline 1-oxidoreductase beta subunit